MKFFLLLGNNTLCKLITRGDLPLDTATHLVIGLGLAGLATIDPVVASNSTVYAATFIGTVVGSQAPDFDTLTRFKSNAFYIRNHRGLSHSIPAWFVWTGLISLLLRLLFGPLPMAHIVMWVFIAVVFHVFTDLFNTYGTQAFRPFSGRWISWNIIHIFDTFIFVSHLIALGLWLFNIVRPQLVFPILYGVIGLYYIWRSTKHAQLQNRLKKQDPEYESGDDYYLLPTYNWNIWNVMKKKPDGTYILGELKGTRLKWVDQTSCTNHPAVEASKKHSNVAALLYFTSFACAEVKETGAGFEVRWADIRYRYRKKYPFVAVLRMDGEYKPLESYVGWVSESKLEKKLKVELY